MKRNKLIALLLLSCFVLIAATMQNREDIGASNGLSYFKEELIVFTQSSKALEQAITHINEDSSSVWVAKKALIKCRLDYKKVEFFLTYFFPSETNFYNAAPVTEVEEPELELVEPMGLQYLEALLFEENPYQNKAKLIEQANIFSSSVNDLHSLLYDFEASDAQLLESLRIELIRWCTLSIAGFDAPLLKTSMSEIEASAKSMAIVVKPYAQLKPKHGQTLSNLLAASTVYLQNHQDFDTFNRLEYLVKYALPLQQQLGLLIDDLGLRLQQGGFVNYDAANSYSKNALNDFIPATASKTNEALMALLGEKLFTDPLLSGNLKVSCASCHQKENYFNDLLPRSASLIADSVLKRNTPTLLYAGWQHNQFWDGRAATLSNQVHEVLFNPIEMGGNSKLLYQNVIANKQYQKEFDRLFPKVKGKKFGADEIAMALSAYIRQLSPMNSAFDAYLNGNTKAMSAEQVEGFNLFMGKAQCGTCHFPPFFNGLFPPFYDRSEVEILGLTKNDDFKTPQLDTDNGRYNLYQINYYKGAFKTPTVRNVAKTSPYMHNGAFNKLSDVVEFYNLGGGKGLGLLVPDQTLSASPLKLNKKEVAAIVAFMEALTDEPITNTKN